jgi:hypothetical protein
MMTMAEEYLVESLVAVVAVVVDDAFSSVVPECLDQPGREVVRVVAAIRGQAVEQEERF